MEPAIAERDAHRATTANAQAIYPFVAEGGLGGRGAYIGRDLYGGSFCFDAFELYAQRALTNPNMLVIGAVGSAKSSLIKSYLFRQAVFGRIPWVIDPKGEYGPLARALGVEPIRLVPGGGITLNPIAPRGGWESRLGLLLAVCAGALGRPLDPEEEAGLREALRVLDARAGAEPTLPDVVELLLRPTGGDVRAAGHHAAARGAARAQPRSGCSACARASCEACSTRRRRPGCDLGGRAVILDLSAVYHSAALGILMTCAAAWQRAAIADAHALADREGRSAPKVITVADEAWKIFPVLGIGEWLQDSFKRSRAYGLQNVIVMHRLSDLTSAGAAGSREVALAEGLLHDAQTRVVYAQYEDEVPRTRELLGLTSVEASILPELDPGIALWKVGRRSFLVQHRLSAARGELVDTDARMLDEPARDAMSADRRDTAHPFELVAAALLGGCCCSPLGTRAPSAWQRPLRRWLGVGAAGEMPGVLAACARTSTIRAGPGLPTSERGFLAPPGSTRRARCWSSDCSPPRSSAIARRRSTLGAQPRPLAGRDARPARSCCPRPVAMGA